MQLQMPALKLSPLHLGNGLGSPLPRHPNLLWAQLAEDRLAATFIADGHHLPTDTLKSMLRAKGISRSILVSDVVSLGGMPIGMYQADVGGAVEVTADGRVISVPAVAFLPARIDPCQSASRMPLPWMASLSAAPSKWRRKTLATLSVAMEPCTLERRPTLFSSNGCRNNPSPARSKYEPYTSQAKN